jgi:hypothetical protein
MNSYKFFAFESEKTKLFEIFELALNLFPVYFKIFCDNFLANNYLAQNEKCPILFQNENYRFFEIKNKE